MKIARLLVVCVGNICRSPLAEHLLRLALPEVDVSSAGIAAVVGADMDATAREAALARGHAVPVHVARQLTPALCQAADLILVMEPGHRDAVARIHAPSRGKVLLLGQGQTPADIPDPYRRSLAVHDAAQQQIERACAAWAQKLRH